METASKYVRKQLNNGAYYLSIIRFFAYFQPYVRMFYFALIWESNKMRNKKEIHECGEWEKEKKHEELQN